MLAVQYDWQPIVTALTPIIVIIIGAISAHYTAKLKAKADKTDEAVGKIHTLVNSEFSALKAENKKRDEVIEALKKELGIANVDNATLAGQVKSDEERRARDDIRTDAAEKASLEERVKVAEATTPPLKAAAASGVVAVLAPGTTVKVEGELDVTEPTKAADQKQKDG